MRTDDRVMGVDLSATLAQVTNQFFARFELRTRGLIPIEIADETDSQRDVVEIIAVHVATIDLPPPAVAHLDLPIASRSSVADYELVRQSVLHPPDVAMVVIENAGVALPRAAVVDHDELPATALHRGAVDFRTDGTGQVTISGRCARPRPEATARRRCWRRLKTLVTEKPGFLDVYLGRLIERNRASSCGLRSGG